MFDGVEGGESDEEEDATEAERGRGQRIAGGHMARELGIQHRRDDERDGAERLDDDERRDRERRELADECRAENQRAEYPGGASDERENVCAREARASRRSRQLLDLLHPATLILRAERHENGARDCEGDAEQEPGIVEEPDELVGWEVRHAENGLDPDHEVERSGTFSESAL